MRDTPTNRDDVIDSRDVIARIEELKDERADLADAVSEAEDARKEPDTDDPELIEDLDDALAEARDALDQWDADNGAELKALCALQDEAEGCSDWRHGETLIRDDYFGRYAREFADDIGAIDRELTWPHNCIDWEQAARELQMDYTSVEFDGVTYWVRS